MMRHQFRMLFSCIESKSHAAKGDMKKMGVVRFGFCEAEITFGVVMHVCVCDCVGMMLEVEATRSKGMPSFDCKLFQW